MSLGKQEKFYLTKEANDYFVRNIGGEEEPPEYIYKRIQQLTDMLNRNNVQPKAILEIGGAGGLFLESLADRFGAECLGVEPSMSAVKYSNENRSGIKVIQGVASDLPSDKSNYYDLVILKGVLCWIGREELFRSIAEIDRVIKDGGYLLIADYSPEYPTRNRNTHVSDEEIYCFKIDHSDIFLKSHLYTVIASETYFDGGETFQGRFDDTRNRVSLLKKSYTDYYLIGNL